MLTFQTRGSFVCPTCEKPTPSLANGQCPDCFNTAQAAWEKKMAVRLDTGNINVQKLVNAMFEQHWMHECKIIPDYMPPFHGNDTRPKCVVAFTDADGGVSYLRHSNGPRQGFSWDIYGDDFIYPELAIVAIAAAIPPPRVGRIVPTYCK